MEMIITLSKEELKAIDATSHPEYFFVGGLVDHKGRNVVLYDGRLNCYVVPFNWFEISGNGIGPDFDDFEIIDCGQTVRLGKYEVATYIIREKICPRQQ